ncbi:MAG: restriction endonuclease subunit M [Cytophagales bacterium CG18_big_fil_WC_8_21_14_2_50_42_9]|nr:MAG: restriction endonuclease subunit M [Cytophagales bacterium CG18_big_fil_WC_8_21_14_2_50_42_9]
MQNLLNDLKELLEKDNRLVAEGQLLRNKITELSLQLDPTLLNLLLSHPNIKKSFFQEVGEVVVFDKVKFQKFVNNKAFLPDSYTAFKNKIGLTAADDTFLSENKAVVLTWPYKDSVLAGGQTKEDTKREEIFWNETLAPDEIDRLLSPKVLTNFKKYDQNGVHAIETLSGEENYLLKGNNLLVLHSLLPVFAGKIKLIYIDPPYNTGNDSFGYNDKFNHSSWLTFMKNRLEVAKKLLHPEGALFIQIDDKEMAYLKVLCDEIFGRENFKESIAVKNGSESGVNAINVMRGEQLFKVKEHILYYAKNNQIHRFKPVYVKAIAFNKSYRLEVKKENGQYTVTDIYKETLLRLFNQDNLRGLTNEQKHIFNAAFEEYCLAHNQHIYALKSDIQKSGDAFKTFAAANKKKEQVEEYTTADGRINLVYKGGMVTPLKERIVEENGIKYYGTLISDFWWDIGATPAAEGNVELKAGKKPEKLLKRIIALCTDENDIVLDFFLGSGSTAATALKMKRRFIGIEQLSYGDNDSIKRLQNVINGDQTGISQDQNINWKGGSSFVSAELKTLNEQYIQEIMAATTEEELQVLLGKILREGFVHYQVKEAPINELETGFNLLSFTEKKQFLKDILDKNLLYLPFSEIDDQDFKIDLLTKNLNQAFYRNVSPG